MTTVLLRRRKNRLLLALQDLESRKNTQTKTETLRRECQKYLLFLVKISRVLSNIEKMCENVRKSTHFISLRSDAILALRTSERWRNHGNLRPEDEYRPI